MNTELERSVADALRAKAGAVPNTPMPRLRRAVETGRTAQARRGRLMPVMAAVVAAVVVGVAAFVLDPGDNASVPVTGTSPTATSPSGLAQGEVYYSLRLSPCGFAEGQSTQISSACPKSSAMGGDAVVEEQLWQTRDRAGEWSQQVATGQSIRNGRVVPDSAYTPPGGVCYPAFSATDDACAAPGSWLNPTVDFLAMAPRDPATIGPQIHGDVAAWLHANDPQTALADNSADVVDLLQLHFISQLLTANGVPHELSKALQQVVAAIPGVEVTEDMANLTGERGSSYSLRDPQGALLTVIFDADGDYIGSPTVAVRHGVAPGLGQPPSRMFD